MITPKTRDLPEYRDDPVGEEAAGLLLNLPGTQADLDAASPHLDNTLSRWTGQSPAHLRIFFETVETHRRLTGIDFESLVDIDELVTRARKDAQAERVRATLSSRPPWAVAAAVLLALGASLVSDQPSSAPTYYSTRVGERLTVKLVDGSTITLNTNSKVAITIDALTRNSRLISGQVLFDVNHDWRPFRVVTDHLTIEDLGTRFNVFESEDRSTVSVIDGRVRLQCECALSDSRNAAAPLVAAQSHQSIELDAGEQGDAIAGEKGTVLNTQQLNPKQLQHAISWQSGLLDMTGMTLAQVVAEVNRYSIRKLVIADPSIAGMAMGGTLKLNVEDFLSMAKETYRVEPLLPEASDPDQNPIPIGKVTTTTP